MLTKVVRVGIRSRIDFPLAESSRRIPDSTRFPSQKLYMLKFCMVVKVKILSIRIYSNMVYANISKKVKKTHCCNFSMKRQCIINPYIKLLLSPRLEYKVYYVWYCILIIWHILYHKYMPITSIKNKFNFYSFCI
jgi:hypothetical protein